MASARPAIPLSDLNQAFEDCRAKLYFYCEEDGGSIFNTDPNPNKVLADERANVQTDDARRQVELRQIELDNLKKDIDRQTTPQQQGQVSDQQFETTQQNYAESQVQLKMAQEKLALLEQGKVTTSAGAIETVVRSPITGFILEKSVELGDPVVPLTTYQEGTVLMTMAAMKDLLFRGTVDEIDVGKLREGMPVTIKIGALPEARIEGVLSRISLKGKSQDNATVFPVEISLTETHGTTLRAGYSANADIVIQRHDSVLTIPERLVTVKDDTARVTVLLPDGSKEARVVKLGLSDAINVQVLDGLAEGDRLVEPPPREIK